MKKERIRGSGWCVCCGDSVGNRAHEALYCWPCYHLVGKATARMGLQVKRAISDGFVKPIKNLTCIDCGLPAKHYDHREIGKPLAVEPVCHGCNIRRGPPRLNKELLEKYLALPTGLGTGKPRGRPKGAPKPKKPAWIGKKKQALRISRTKHQMRQWAVIAKARRGYQIRNGVGASDLKDSREAAAAPVRRGLERTRA